MFVSFFVKLVELITLVFTSSYFFTVLWVLLCEGIEDFILGEAACSTEAGVA